MSERPPTARGLKTQRKILAAAREMFESVGFEDTRMTDIASRAGVSNGTVFFHFHSKDQIFAAVMTEVLRTEFVYTGDEADDPYRRLLNFNTNYISAFRRNRTLMRAVIQVAELHPVVSAQWNQLRMDMVNANIRAITRWQRDGRASKDIEPRYAAICLNAMVERAVHLSVGVGDDVDDDELARTVSLLWIRGLGMHDVEPAP